MENNQIRKIFKSHKGSGAQSNSIYPTHPSKNEWKFERIAFSQEEWKKKQKSSHPFHIDFQHKTKFVVFLIRGVSMKGVTDGVESMLTWSSHCLFDLCGFKEPWLGNTNDESFNELLISWRLLLKAFEIVGDVISRCFESF